MSDEQGYNGWVNRDTWAMALDLGNDEVTYRMCEALARYAAIGNEDDPEAFRDELADQLKQLGYKLLATDPGYLPDFDPSQHESPDPRDNHGPDDIEGVDWHEIAETYDLDEYV